MELETNSDATFLNTVPHKKVTRKIVISVVLGLLPIVLSSIMTFMSFPLRELPTFGIGIVIGLTLIPFMLFITNDARWGRKWYIWVAMSAVILIAAVLPMFKGSLGAANMQRPMNGNIRMEKMIY